MNHLTPLLESVADRADLRLLPGPEAVRAAGDRRTRRIRSAAASVLVVLLLIALVLVKGNQAARVDPVRPAPVPVLPKTDAGLAYVRHSGFGVSLGRVLNDTAVSPFVNGPASKRTCGSCYPVAMAWSPDQTRLALIIESGVWKQSVYLFANHRLRKLFDCPGGHGPTCDTQYRSPLSWAPDSRHLGFSSEQVPYVADVTDGSYRRLRCGGCSTFAPVWSPDGRVVALFDGHAVYLLPASGGNPRRILDQQVSSVAWSPEGTRLAAAAFDGVHVIGLRGHVTQRVVAAQSAAEGPGAPAWSPDGRRIAYFSTPGSSGHFRAQVWLADADGSDRRLLRDFGCCIDDWQDPVWSPDGRRIALGLMVTNGHAVRVAKGLVMLDSRTGRVIENLRGSGPVAWRAGPVSP